MSAALDALAPSYRACMGRWPEAPTLVAHYYAVSGSFEGNSHGLIETVKSFLECVCLTVLGEFGTPMPSGMPSTTDLLVECLRILGVGNTRGASKLDKVLSSYNRLSDALSECRNEVGPIAHGKDGFLDALCESQLRAYLLVGDTLLALILAALEGTEPDIRHTREPYEAFGSYHERIDNSVFVHAEVDDESETPVFILTIGAANLSQSIELRVEPSRLLYSVDRAAFIEMLAASTVEAAQDGEPIIEFTEVKAADTMPKRPDDEVPLISLTSSYEGGLQHLQGAFSEYLLSLLVKPDQQLGSPPACLADSLLDTAERQMHVDWQEREVVKSTMRVALRQVLVRFGTPVEDAKPFSEHIVSWLQIQLAAAHAQQVHSE